MMKQVLFSILFFVPLFACANNNTSEVTLELYLDSLISVNDIDLPKAKSQFLDYAKKNYKGADNVKDFVDYSSKKMKSKEKEFTKNSTKELHELYSFAIMANKHLRDLEEKIYTIFRAEGENKSEFMVDLYLTLHEMNYWELNSYKPNQLGCKLAKFYSLSSNFELNEKLCLYILAAKIYKASYYVNPMHLCETHYAKTEITMDMDSLNLNTNNLTIDSIPAGIKPPIFIGGTSKLNNYISNNLKYPEKAISAAHQGRVILSFKVDERGNIFEPRVKLSPSEYLSKEALRLIASLPKWQSDINTKEGVGFTKFTMPFDFTIPED